MALRELLESIEGEVCDPEIVIPFSPEDLNKLRIGILESSGAFSEQSIAQQIEIDSDKSLISKFITIEVVEEEGKKIDPARIAASLEEEQFNENNLLNISFGEFREAIFDVEDRLMQLRNSKDLCERKFAEELEALIDTDPIIVALQNGLETLIRKRNLEGVPFQDVDGAISLSFPRAIKTQKAVLIGINKFS
jgi:hypothetical protein